MIARVQIYLWAKFSFRKKSAAARLVAPCINFPFPNISVALEKFWTFVK